MQLTPPLCSCFFVSLAVLLMLTGESAAQSVSVETLSYGANSAQRLDLHTPDSPPASPIPAVLLAHGGLWQGGDKSALATLCNKIVVESEGAIACASMNYRLSQNLGGVCSAPGVDTYSDQVDDMALAYAFLLDQAATYSLDPTRLYVGGHSAGGHLSHELNLRWDDYAQPCALPSGCPPTAGAIGFEGIYDIAAWDSYDDTFWDRQFACATRKAFGAPPGASPECLDSGYGEPCWSVGSPTYLAVYKDALGISPAGDALIIHSPGDNWVDIAEATVFGAAMSAAFPDIEVVTSTDGSCATGQHNDPLTQTTLATCIVNFVPEPSRFWMLAAGLGFLVTAARVRSRGSAPD
jgi:acetyl esterase/lipase